MSSDLQGVSCEAVAGFLQEEGYRAKIHNDARTWIESGLVGLKFRIYFYSPFEIEGDTFYRNYMFDAGYAISLGSKVERLAVLCNEFNAEYRFLKAFIVPQEDGGYVALQMDESVSQAGLDGVKNAFDFYRRGIEVFQKKVIETPAYYGDNAPKDHNDALQCLKDPAPDPEKAISLYYKAAQVGFAGSQNNLGDLYEQGRELPLSDVCATYWYVRAAERGEPTAYLSLASLLERAAVDTYTLIEAMKYSLLALKHLPGENNKEKAQKASQKIEERLSEAQIAAAKSLADNWEPLFQERRLMGDTDDSDISKVNNTSLLN